MSQRASRLAQSAPPKPPHEIFFEQAKEQEAAGNFVKAADLVKRGELAKELEGCLHT